MKRKDAIAYYGTAADLARALGISRQAVFKWGPEVPPRRQYELERLTAGKLRIDRDLVQQVAA